MVCLYGKRQLFRDGSELPAHPSSRSFTRRWHRQLKRQATRPAFRGSGRITVGEGAARMFLETITAA